MIPLRQATTSQGIVLPRFVDEVDGFTPETLLTINNTSINLFKNGGAAVSAENGATHSVSGVYGLTLGALDTDTVGRLQIECKPTGARGVEVYCQVLEPVVYDALYADAAPGFASATVCTLARLQELDAGNLPADVAANLAAIQALNNLDTTQVKAQVVEALEGDVHNLPGQLALPLQPSYQDCLLFLFKWLRNPKNAFESEWQLMDDAGTTVDQKASISGSPTLVSKGKVVSGP